jgi:hypothetical protein
VVAVLQKVTPVLVLEALVVVGLVVLLQQQMELTI